MIGEKGITLRLIRVEYSRERGVRLVRILMWVGILDEEDVQQRGTKGMRRWGVV